MSWKLVYQKIRDSYKWVFKHNIYKAEYKKHGNKFIGKNIYHEDLDMKGYYKRQNRVHAWFKYCFLVPALSIGQKILGKFLVKEVPKAPQFDNLKLFEESMDIAMIKWQDMFCRNIGTRRISAPGHIKNWFNSNHPGSNVNMLRMMRSILNTVCVNDTAYFELFNMISFEYSKKLSEKYQGEVKHPLYLSKSIHDPSYFAAIGQSPDKKMVYLGEIVLSEDGISTIKSKYKL